MKVLITGGAGFIGSATAKALMERGDTPILIDNFNDYYDPKLKEDRINFFLKEKNNNAFLMCYFAFCNWIVFIDSKIGRAHV